MATKATYTAQYLQMFNTMQIKPEKMAEVNAAVKKINAGIARYKSLQQTTNVPWFVIGLIHHMEANCDFTKHLHNGDPLTARTKQVPAGYPKTGTPPFTWEASATDALKLKALDKVTDWSIGNMLYLLENFNGAGYRNRGIVSPYLWSYSNLYTKGKYVADGVFDANAVSKQAGVAVILKQVMKANNLLTAAVVAGGSGLLLLFIAAAILIK